MPHRVIPILPDLRARRPGTPRLVGNAADVQRVLAALQAAIGAAWGAALPAEAWLQELHLGPDEARLLLATGLGGSAIDLALTAFVTLRQLLPDTDIYVRPGLA